MISIVAAMNRHRVIGRDGRLPWHLPSDLAHFKKLTWGHPVIMGRKTYESLPDRFRPLHNRVNIVLSRDKTRTFTEAIKFGTLEQALAHTEKEAEVFIIGGESVFKRALSYAKRLYLTIVETDCAGDVFFPEFEFDGWQLTEQSAIFQGEKDDHPMFFSTFARP